MNFLSYSLTALISFLGLITGMIVMYMAKEEQKPGGKYFILLQKIILLLIVISMLYFLKLDLIIFIIILSIIIISYIKKYKNKELIESCYIYPILGLIFYLSSKNKSLIIIESSLIFLYGITTGSLLMKKSANMKNILINTSFIFVAILFYTIL